MRQNRSNIIFELVTDLDEIDENLLKTALLTYCQAFRAEPYRENCSEADARSALKYLLFKGGYLVLGKIDQRVVAVAGGYPDGAGIYLDEMAIAPEFLGVGLGPTMVQTLMDVEPARSAEWFKLRTSVANSRALRVYQSLGFVPTGTSVAVPYLRSDQTITVDERIYLVRQSTVNIGKQLDERSLLHRVAVVHTAGNTTAVVFDRRSSDDRKLLNAVLPSAIAKQCPELPAVEQCCFITPPRDPTSTIRMEMFGEFCGNAARSVAWLATGGADYIGLIEASGSARPLRFQVVDGIVQLEMPLKERENITEEIDGGLLVRLDGITHVVVTDPAIQRRYKPREFLRLLLENANYNLSSQVAVGITYYDTGTTAAEFCVWVRNAETVFDETACGSGTSAIGIALATAARNSLAVDVIQPSGETISTSAAYDPDVGVSGSQISGEVKTLFDGEVKL